MLGAGWGRGSVGKVNGAGRSIEDFWVEGLKLFHSTGVCCGLPRVASCEFEMRLLSHGVQGFVMEVWGWGGELGLAWTFFFI